MGLLLGLGGPGGHLASGIFELTGNKLKVPCCGDCRLIHRLGFLLGLVFLFVGLGLVFGLMLVGPAKVMRMSVAATVLQIFGGFSLIVAGAAVSDRISRAAAPVAIYRRKDGLLYYEFRSKRFQQHLLNSLKSEPVTASGT